MIVGGKDHFSKYLMLGFRRWNVFAR